MVWGFPSEAYPLQEHGRNAPVQPDGLPQTVAREKACLCLRNLALADEPLRQRLHHACFEFLISLGDNLPPGSQQKKDFDRIREMLMGEHPWEVMNQPDHVLHEVTERTIDLCLEIHRLEDRKSVDPDQPSPMN